MIHDDFSFNDYFSWEDPGLSVRNMQRIKDLRTLMETIEKKLEDLEKDPIKNKELIPQEKALLEAAQREITRLQRQSFYSQLRLD